MCITHKPASTPMVANCAARFFQDIVHESLIYKHIIHIANTCAVLCTSVSVLVDVKLTNTMRKTQPSKKKINDRSKAVLLSWMFYVFLLFCDCYAFVRVCLYTDPKWKLYIVFKSIYFDDKLSFGVNFSVMESSMPYRCLWKKCRMKNINCIIFMNNAVQRGQNEKF